MLFELKQLSCKTLLSTTILNHFHKVFRCGTAQGLQTIQTSSLQASVVRLGSDLSLILRINNDLTDLSSSRKLAKRAQCTTAMLSEIEHIQIGFKVLTMLQLERVKSNGQRHFGGSDAYQVFDTLSCFSSCTYFRKTLQDGAPSFYAHVVCFRCPER